MTPRPEGSRLRHLTLAAAAGAAFLTACSPVGPATVRSSPSPTASAPAPDAPRSGGDADARFKSALALMKARQFDDARAAFIALSKDFPAFSGPLTNLGILYAQGKQRDAALASFSRAVDANPQNTVALNWLGILYRESGDNVRAESTYKRAIAARPDYAPAVMNLGILYDVFLHRPADALARYRDYQRITGGENLIVAAWIRDLESPAATPTAVATAALQP